MTTRAIVENRSAMSKLLNSTPNWLQIIPNPKNSNRDGSPDLFEIFIAIRASIKIIETNKRIVAPPFFKS